MAQVTIDGLLALDGTYQLDLTFTHRDFRTIKTMTGLRSSEVMDAIENGDTDIFVALAAIAVRRAGVDFNPDNLWDLPIGGLTLDFTEDEAEDVEETPPQGDDATRNDGDVASSGTPSNGGTGSSPEITTPNASGTPQPDSTSVPATSMT